MGFGVEDDVLQIDRLGGSEEEVEIFEGLGQGEAFHLVAFLYRDNVLERGVTGISAAMFHEVICAFD
jgi:hypothetical protein